MPSVKMKDISVVVPTLNCRRLIEPVVPILRETLSEVGEVVVVDSDSEDGTVELLKESLDPSNVRFLSHPRGLYASWNYGIGQTTKEWLYIATAGDVASKEDLGYLLGVARATGADVVSAPPQFVDEDGTVRKDPSWPILNLLKGREGEEVIELAAGDLVAFALCHCWPSRRYKSWLGSSASNLYRAATVKELPFPTDVGPTGDVLWGIRNANRVRAAFCRRRCGRFVVHSKPGGVGFKDKGACYETAWNEAIEWLWNELGMGDGSPELGRLLGLLQKERSIVEETSRKLRKKATECNELRQELKDCRQELRGYKAYVGAMRGRVPRVFRKYLFPPIDIQGGIEKKLE